MKKEVELEKINRKHEKNRQQSSAREKQLLSSLVERGIDEPLQGVLSKSGEVILLDGFKRLRCAIKLRMGTVPFFSIDENEAVAILQMLKTSNAKTLTLLEQASFVEELKTQHGLSTAEIAEKLGRSKSWVLVRLNTKSELSESTADAILSGKFPFYSYFYTLQPHMRISGIATKKEIDEFVTMMAGRNLSTRDIDLLSNAYFRGGSSMRDQIKNGNLGWCLQELKERKKEELSAHPELLEVEKKVLRDLDQFQNCMARLNIKLTSPTKLENSSFYSQADILVDGILCRIEMFSKTLKDFYDRQ